MDVLRGSKTTSVELPHSRFIPESDRQGWRDSSKTNKRGSGSNTPSTSYARRHSNILHFGSIWSSPIGKLKALVPVHGDNTFEDEEEDEIEEHGGSSIHRGYGRERSNSMPSSIRSGESRPFLPSGQTATSTATLMWIQMPPDADDPRQSQDILQSPLERPFVVPHQDFESFSSSMPSSAATTSEHTPRGYPWRSETGDGKSESTSFFVPPSHRNATGSQAFYDTHFGSSSNWRSVKGIADDTHYRSRAKNYFGKLTNSGKEKRVLDSDIKTAEAVEERKRESLLSWHSLNTLSSLGLNNLKLSSARRESSADIALRQAYEPILLPSVHRDPQASGYFKNLTGNVIIMGGYRGSILRDSETHQMMWVPLKVGAGLRKPTLTLGLTPEAEDRSEDFVIADEMLGGITSMVDMGKRLIHRCSTKHSKVYSWGFDWRLSLGRSSERLEAFLYQLWLQSAENEEDRMGAKVIAHSMGGLVALHALARSKRPEIFSSMVFASTPFLGASNILGPLRFGDIALFNDEICSPRATFSFRSSFYLLPIDPADSKDEGDKHDFNTRGGRCFEQEDGTPIDLDFLDPETWNDLGLSPCVEVGKRREVLSKSRKRAESQGLTLGYQLEKSASKRQEEGLDLDNADQLQSNAVPSFSMGMDLNMTSPSDPRSARQEATKAGQTILNHTVSGIENESKLQSANRQDSNSLQDEIERKGSNLSKDELTEIREDEASEAWLYLERTLAETRQFHYELYAGFKESFFEQKRYPPMAILTSGSTPTVRGALVKPTIKGGSKDQWKQGVREGDYSRMLYAPGDGIILKRSSTALPGDWSKLLVRGQQDDPTALTNHEGVVETNHRHITLLSDVDAVGRCLEACRRAREHRLE